MDRITVSRQWGLPPIADWAGRGRSLPRKILAVLLALQILLGAVPVAVLAAVLPQGRTVDTPAGLSYYHWQGHPLEVSHERLLEDLKAAATDPDDPVYGVVEPGIARFRRVELSSELPAEEGEVTVTRDGDITVTWHTTGVRQLRLRIRYDYAQDGKTREATAEVPVQFLVLDVQPSSFVLDQGLPMELSYEDLFGTDVLTLPQRDTTVEILGIAGEDQPPGYEAGQLVGFTPLEGWSLTAADGYQADLEVCPQARGEETFLRYVPRDFLSGRDTIHIALRVRETASSGDGGVDIGNEVVMVKTVTFLPANVVYYEENIPALQVIGGTFRNDDDLEMLQSPDQDLPFGYDPVYAFSEDVTMSGGSFATVPIVPPADGQPSEVVPAARFTFTGTGFELVTMTDSLFAMALQVDVYQKGEDGADELLQRIPVITSYSDRLGGVGSGVVIYQVPMVRICGLTHGTYTVQVSGVPLVVGQQEDGSPVYGPTTYIYIDGVRIFQPLEDATQEEYGKEWGASFTELRSLVLDGKAAVLGLAADSISRVGLVGTTGSGISFREDRGRDLFQLGAGGDMKSLDANNEVYVGGTSGSCGITFYVSVEEARTGLLHIGARDVHEDLYRGLHGAQNQPSSFHYLLADGSWSQKIQVGQCGTEQYHPVDLGQCPTVVQDGVTYYQVLIRVSAGLISFTNIKIVGCGFGDLFVDREKLRYRYDGFGLYQAQRFDQEGRELPEKEAVWQDAPRDPQCQYKTEDGRISYAWRYDAQGRELPTDQLVWLTDGVMLGYHYKVEDGVLYRAARYDAYAKEIQAAHLQWQTVDSEITASMFRAGAALIASAEQDRIPESPEPPLVLDEVPAQSWWGRFLQWLLELLRMIAGSI